MLAGHIGNYSRYEIEKKFLLKELPTPLPSNYVDIEDLYLCNSSLRFRVEISPSGEIIGRKLTKKDKAPDKGPETSIITSLYLSEADYISLGMLKGSSIKKRRHIVEDHQSRIVYDQFKGNLDGLLMAEIEFKDRETFSKFELKHPDWIEVTGNPKYSGGYLAFNSKNIDSND